MDMKKKRVAIVKGIDGYIEMTPLAEYCRERGWVILEEYIIIEMPTGKELLKFKRDVKDGKIVVLKKGGS